MKKNMDFISYPFLGEKKRLVEHEMLTDELASRIGLVLSLKPHLYDETFWLMDKVYHLNGSIRGKQAIDESDLEYALQMYRGLKERNAERFKLFVYPTGHPIACQYHMARTQAKKVVRHLHILRQEGMEINQLFIDFANLVANILFGMAIETNRIQNIDEIEFISKSY